MTLKELCGAIHEYTKKLEAELKIELNDLQNQYSSNKLDELKLAQENAKNYHYDEIMHSLSVIYSSIKKLEFHMAQIEWVSDNTNKEQLRRFSYVKRQIYAFSQNGSSDSAENALLSKKEQRRSAAELSIGSLGAWENYMKQKEEEEQDVKLNEVPKPVVRRKPLNIKKRKKFVSSTYEEFLDKETNNELYVIAEDEAKSQMSLNTDSSSYYSLNTLADDEKAFDINEINSDDGELAEDDTKSIDEYFEILDKPGHDEDINDINSDPLAHENTNATNSESNNSDKYKVSFSDNHETISDDKEKPNEKMLKTSKAVDKPRIVDVVVRNISLVHI